MNMIKKTTLTAIAILGLGVVTLSAGANDANAGGWKKFKRFHHFTGHHYNYKHGYGYNHGYGHYCKPRYRKIWVWSPYHGRKILKWVRIGKRCY